MSNDVGSSERFQEFLVKPSFPVVDIDIAVENRQMHASQSCELRSSMASLGFPVLGPAGSSS